MPPLPDKQLLLGPLGTAASAAQWRWVEIQADGHPQSPQRPTTRFHHTLTKVGPSAVVVYGGQDFQMRALGDACILDLSSVDRQSFGSVEWLSIEPPNSDEEGSEDEFDDTKRFNVPAPRYRHAAAAWAWDSRPRS